MNHRERVTVRRMHANAVRIQSTPAPSAPKIALGVAADSVRKSRPEIRDVFDRSIDVQILRLRRKLETNASRPQIIKTQRGLGYIFSSKVETIA